MQLRERIIENSMELFLQKGCKSVTMDDIATLNGISKRTLYENFSDKSQLLDECIDYTGKKIRSKIKALLETSNNVLDMLFKSHDMETDVVINLRVNFFTELKRFYPDIHHKWVSRFSEYHKQGMMEFLNRGQKEGLILNNIDKEIVSKMIIEISNIIGNKDIFSLENVSRKQLFKETQLYYFRGISTEEGQRIIDEYFNK